MIKPTIKLLLEFDTAYDVTPPIIPFYGKLRYGQALCSNFILPEEIEEKLYYNESRLECSSIIWNYLVELENR